MDNNDYTPGPIPQPIMQGNQSSAIRLGYIVQPPPPDQQNILAIWWKQLVVFIAGVATFGAVAFFVARAFFVPREEWLALVSTIQDVSNRLKHIEEKMQANSDALIKLHERANMLDVMLATQGISAEPPKIRRRRSTSQ